MGSKHFHELLQVMASIHDQKNHDYAQEENPFSNFERASELVKWFTSPIDQVFAGIIGIKLARLAELSNGKTPNNESIDDTRIDLSNYCVLWAALYKWKLNQEELVKFIDKQNSTSRMWNGPTKHNSQ